MGRWFEGRGRVRERGAPNAVSPLEVMTPQLSTSLEPGRTFHLPQQHTGLSEDARKKRLARRSADAPVLQLGAQRDSSGHVGGGHAACRLVVGQVLPPRLGAERVRQLLAHSLDVQPACSDQLVAVLHAGLRLDGDVGILLVLRNLFVQR